MKALDIIVAADNRRGIGIQGRLPWSLKKDMSFFRAITLAANPLKKAESFGVILRPDKKLSDFSTEEDAKNAVIMGRKTWESIPDRAKPLSGRQNLVISSILRFTDSNNSKCLPGYEEALEFCENSSFQNCFIIGGASLYERAISTHTCRYIFYTEIMSEFRCDVFFPEFKMNFREIGTSPPYQENGISFRFKVFSNP